MTIHNFKDSLALSNKYSDAPWWEITYKKAFPNFEVMMCVRQDGWAQRGGIDRVIILKSGKKITIDEKVRQKDWDDILLERWSDKDRKIPGWIQKDLACDYIAYAFVKSQQCYIFPTLQLRLAWIQNGRDWIKKYKPVLADNKTYVTESIPIPKQELINKICDAMLINWGVQNQVV